MNHRQKEIMKFIALGCIVAVVFITSRFIPVSKIVSLYTDGTSVSTEASPTELSSDAAAAPKLSSDAEIAAELASRIANMTLEERKEAQRPPLPDENKAQLINPNGETLYQQYRGNYAQDIGLTFYGNVFGDPPTRHSFEGKVPNPQVVLLSDSPTDPDLTKKSTEIVTNIFSFRFQNYSGLICALSAFKSEYFLPSALNPYIKQCIFESIPAEFWPELMEQDAYLRVDALYQDTQKGDMFYNYILSPENNVEIFYTVYLAAYGKNNAHIRDFNPKKVRIIWKKIDNDWKIDSFDFANYEMFLK